MYNKIKFILLVCLVIQTINAQHYKHSPYSKYGIGDLIPEGSSYNSSLGGTGIALRPQNHINYCNPASLTNQDTCS